ncbi:SidA/IucD/PvdA family monooxygenase [Thermopolyspora sp. NPDC052614]|uniref:lysine N(6)-hydroxylase/L-ornithine N(5)-oxygenase family protein n=1 Tax=Thermopolyspora sp. NPDC052614 TaxID=3155682 RepID=UPI00341ABD3E
MHIRENDAYEIVGVGFGPSNLSLAIALREHPSNTPEQPIRAAFFEKQPQFGWHRNMLLPGVTMQVSFLKDLVTFRNPLSPFSFISYLHRSGRLPQFVNNQDFFPTREEFHDYLEWAQRAFSDQVFYGSEVVAIRRPAGGDAVTHLELEVRDPGGDVRVIHARNVVISTGLVPRMPEGVSRDDRVWHSSEFLEKFRAVDRYELKSVAVIGGGQSAAEITRFLYDELPHAQIHSITPSYGYSLADDTPFANRVFDPEAVDHYYFGSSQARHAFWHFHRNTNYSVVDRDVIHDLYRRWYGEVVRNTNRLQFRNLTRLAEVKRSGSETRLLLHSLIDDDVQEVSVDAVACGTGYDPMEPTRLLGDLGRHCPRDASGRLQVARDYRVLTTPELECGIYLQGGTEHSHGLTSSLLSNIALRSGEIADSIVRNLTGR